eukprot:CAMPEP_0117756544 /NCGR_PEP_ID=MMETSP0947-20121206/14146_1 /TAXON_ID=44440 /ORGANISM="Chattonella subsalsa, Strain CCMP2191" /LENGTH=209 /DNA_ID=CAMNT_0005576161 /DNA_START=247 /DNA_END=877 /DNA_ORIENTATION=-
MVLQSENDVTVKKDIEASVPKAKTNSVNDKLLAEITDFKRPLEAQLNASATIEYEEQDLNGVSPKYALLGSFLAAFLSVASYKITTVLFEIYEAQKDMIGTDNLFATRLSGLLKQVIVGLGSLATGIFAFNALGLLLLSIKVTNGVMKGELDPTPKPQQEDKILSLDDIKLYDYDDLSIKINKDGYRIENKMNSKIEETKAIYHDLCNE